MTNLSEGIVSSANTYLGKISCFFLQTAPQVCYCIEGLGAVVYTEAIGFFNGCWIIECFCYGTIIKWCTVVRVRVIQLFILFNERLIPVCDFSLNTHTQICIKILFCRTPHCTVSQLGDTPISLSVGIQPVMGHIYLGDNGGLHVPMIALTYDCTPRQ